MREFVYILNMKSTMTELVENCRPYPTKVCQLFKFSLNPEKELTFSILQCQKSKSEMHVDCQT